MQAKTTKGAEHMAQCKSEKRMNPWNIDRSAKVDFDNAMRVTLGEIRSIIATSGPKKSAGKGTKPSKKAAEKAS